MVLVFRADREVVKACKDARRAHREALTNNLDMALEYGDSGRAWELARLLANKTARWVKPRPIPPTRETERHEMDAHIHPGPRPTVPMWLYGGDCCIDPSSSKTNSSTRKISCSAKLSYS